MKKVLSALMVLAVLLTMTACHGTLVSRDSAAAASSSYQIPETFDESRDYEITFWAKNDTNATQVSIYKQAIADFESA